MLIFKRSKIMKLASEKSLNRGVFPVMCIKGKKVKYPFEIKYKSLGFACGEGFIGPKQLMIMDVIGTQLIHKMFGTNSFAARIPMSKDTRVKEMSGKYMSYKLIKYFTEHLSPIHEGKIPESWYSDDGKLYHIDKKFQRIKKPITLIINDGILKKEVPYFKRFSSLQISEMIKKTADCLIVMNYPIRNFNGNDYKTFPFNTYRLPSRFFSLIEITKSKLSKDSHVLEREYTIRLDTILGYLFQQNVASSYIDLIPGKFYDMSDYTQLFYRLLILPYFGKVKNPISIEEVKNRLVLKTRDTYMVRKMIKLKLDELEANGFISDPKEITKHGGYLYGYQKKSWKDITLNKDDISGTHLCIP